MSMATGFGRILKNALNHEVGSGNVVSEQRDVGDFDEMTLSGVGNLSITQTGSESLTIEAEDNILPLLTSEVHGRRLVLGTEPGTHFSPKRPIRFTLTVKDLSAVRISGAGNAEIPALGAQSLRLEISGAGNMTVTGLAAESVEVTLSGAGSMTCAGEVRSQDVRISGAGSYHGEDLASVTARVAHLWHGQRTSPCQRATRRAGQRRRQHCLQRQPVGAQVGQRRRAHLATRIGADSY